MRSTPHINPTAPIAPTILLPGDPLRAKFIAETYLEDAQQFNAVRNMLGYTGTYRGTPVSVMGSGMGIPSISLYAHELIHEFGCTRLVRVGTCGALQPDVNLYDVVVAQAACSNSAFLDQYQIPGSYAPIGSFRLIEDVVRRAREADVPIHVGNILSSDTFYNAPVKPLSRCMSATSCPPMSSTTRTRPSTRPGSAWACSRSRWSPPACTRLPPTRASRPWVSLRSRTPWSRARPPTLRRVRRPLPP